MPVDTSRRKLLRSLGAVSVVAGAGALGTRSGAGGQSARQQSDGLQSSDGEWPSYQYDIHNSGYNPTVAIDDVEDIERRWVAETRYQITKAPVVADGTVYVGSEDSTLYAFDLQDGSTTWTYDTEGQFRSTPAVVDGTVYVANHEGNVFAIDTETGDLEWKESLFGWLYTPVVAGEIVYIGTQSGVTAIDRKTGELEWESEETEWEIRSSPTIGDDGVFVSEISGRRIYAFEQSTGNLRWEYETGASSNSSPAYVDGTVFCGSLDERLYALDAETGELKWEFDTGNEIRISPAVADGVVYVGNWNGVFAIDADDGSEVWHTPDPSPRASLGLTPSYVIAPGRSIRILNRENGREVSHIELDDRPTSPALVDGSLVFGSRDHNVYAYDLNEPIDVSFAVTPADPEPGETVTFEAESVDGDPTYEWELDEGTESEGRTVQHAYDNPGEYNVELTVRTADSVGRHTETIEVLLPPVVGDNPPTDPDGDGLYEDVTGSGTVSIVDVQALYQHLDSDAIQSYPDAYDFSGNGEVSIADVQALYSQLTGDQ